jgi:mannose-6-phosphate isomerase-like protein (cupin superfamily)
METHYLNIEKATLQNKAYRHVIYTDPNLQIVLMRLGPNEDIHMEVHEGATQFIRIESGVGISIVESKWYVLADGVSITIPPGHRHKISNTSSEEPLLLYTIYSPPQHKSKTYQLEVVQRGDKM